MGTVCVSEQELRQLKTELKQLKKENQDLQNKNKELKNNLEKRKNSNLTWDEVLDEIETEGTLSDKELKKLLRGIEGVGKHNAHIVVNSDKFRRDWIPVKFQWLVGKTSYD